ncbi:MAG: helix-turn-helix domain-containing protein [Olsenella sp.]|nr:helix-turn-helix domain-containing protein [Olsenella sp.]
MGQNNYRSSRQAADISAREAASALSLSSLDLERIERGVAEPDAMLLRHMAKLYGCTSDHLLAIDQFDVEGKRGERA